MIASGAEGGYRSWKEGSKGGADPWQSRSPRKGVRLGQKKGWWAREPRGEAGGKRGAVVGAAKPRNPCRAARLAKTPRQRDAPSRKLSKDTKKSCWRAKTAELLAKDFAAVVALRARPSAEETRGARRRKERKRKKGSEWF